MLPNWFSQIAASFTGDTLETLSATPSVNELVAAKETTVLAPLVHWDAIRFSGEETISFLQNQLSSDVKIVGKGEAQYSSYSTPKGRMLASFLLIPEANKDVLTLVSRDLRDAMLKRLSMFIMRSKVKASAPEIALLGVAGPKAESLIQEQFGAVPNGDYATASFEQGTIVRLPNLGFVIALAADQVGAVWAKLSTSAQVVSPQTWQWLEIQSGVIRISAATQELFVPQMTNFDRIGAVSFTKGCYPGQEIVARTQYLGKLKKRTYLASVKSDTPVLAGQSVYSSDFGEQAAGQIANAAANGDGSYDILVVLQTSCVEHGVTLGSNQGPALSFKELPYEVL